MALTSSPFQTFSGKAVQLLPLEIPRTQMSASGASVERGFAELRFDHATDSVNKFNAETLNELAQAVELLKKQKGVRGLLMSSGKGSKDVFVVGADITEFLGHFKKSDAEMKQWLHSVHQTFNAIEDLDFPVIAALDGVALGGGFEVALTAAFRVMSSKTKVGLPETKLGIFPGWGGTVRLSRRSGADCAIEWIASGEQWKADAALRIRAVDAVVAPEHVRSASLQMLLEAADGKLDWRARQAEKKAPLKLNAVESSLVFEGSKAFVGAKAGPHYPAPVAAIEVIQKGARLERDAALAIEVDRFVEVAKTPTAAALVAVFLGDQAIKKLSKKAASSASSVQFSAVLGAGIMGGGVAYQSASRKVPILMKDIAPAALDLGLREATQLLEKQVSRGKLTAFQMAETLGRIRPTLSYGDFGAVDFVVEAVVENEKVKKSVLAEVEKVLKPGAILSSNTSTISITRLAEGLSRPEDFVGMHFFNPVHKMPLVEVIRGKKSSERAVATAVSYALAMGKTPIVVNDCPGFLVNRVLFPYFAGLMHLIRDGVDFQRMDRVMEKYGWPMGPAYLLDVVGLDTAHHADAVMAAEFPDRMKHTGKTAIEWMYENKRFGQKNGLGFYRYVPDKKGIPKKSVDPEVVQALKAVQGSKTIELTDEQIVERMMLPMIFECSRCLEEGIVSSAVEVDMGLIFGLGFPPFRGGIFRSVDAWGLPKLVESAKAYRDLGKLYEPTQQILEMAKAGKTFYPA